MALAMPAVFESLLLSKEVILLISVKIVEKKVSYAAGCQAPV